MTTDRELLTQAEDLLTQLWKELLSVKPWLDKPYPDAPELSPWTRRSEALARRAHDLSLKLRGHLQPLKPPGGFSAAECQHAVAETAGCYLAVPRGDLAGVVAVSRAQQDELDPILGPAFLDHDQAAADLVMAAYRLGRKHDDRPQVETQNRGGQWVPAIPLPFYGLRKHCECGRKFWTAEGYEGHYALAHVLKVP